MQLRSFLLEKHQPEVVFKRRLSLGEAKAACQSFACSSCKHQAGEPWPELRHPDIARPLRRPVSASHVVRAMHVAPPPQSTSYAAVAQRLHCDVDAPPAVVPTSRNGQPSHRPPLPTTQPATSPASPVEPEKAEEEEEDGWTQVKPKSKTKPTTNGQGGEHGGSHGRKGDKGKGSKAGMNAAAVVFEPQRGKEGGHRKQAQPPQGGARNQGGAAKTSSAPPVAKNLVCAE